MTGQLVSYQATKGGGAKGEIFGDDGKTYKISASGATEKLMEGDYVEFDVEVTPEGPTAVNVKKED